MLCVHVETIDFKCSELYHIFVNTSLMVFFLQLRYANNSQYKNDTMIRKEVFCSSIVIEELKRIINDAEIFQEDDSKWPEPDRTGRQELEVIMGDEHISFATTKLGSMLQVFSIDLRGHAAFGYCLPNLSL